ATSEGYPAARAAVLMPDGAVMSGRGARGLDQAQADQHGETLKQAETAGDLPLNLPCRPLAPRRCSLQIVTRQKRRPGGGVACRYTPLNPAAQWSRDDVPRRGRGGLRSWAPCQRAGGRTGALPRGGAGGFP